MLAALPELRRVVKVWPSDANFILVQFDDAGVALQLARQDSYRNVSPDEVPELCDGLRRAAERSFSHPGRAGK